MINLSSKQLSNLEDLLTDLEEYMQPKADIEDGVDFRHVPNKEMKFLDRIQEALGQLKTKLV